MSEQLFYNFDDKPQCQFYFDFKSCPGQQLHITYTIILPVCKL